MMTDMTRTIEILARLVAFPTVSARSNLDLIDWVQELLSGAGFEVARITSDCGEKAGLLARFGAGQGGVLLSGHTDVVPVEGQVWTVPPFELTRCGDRLHGRGSTDMKGFVACALALAETLRDSPPAQPVMLALSWDEEIGCRGIPHMIDHVIPTLGRPELCIVGEPTMMRPGTGHKGKVSYLATCRGQAGHSAMAPRFTNALHLAADLIQSLRAEQARLLREGAQDQAYDPAVSTTHAGTIQGGVALNVVPDHAEVAFEIRHLASESPDDILANIRASLPAGIEIRETGRYPGLESEPGHAALAAFCGGLPDARPVKLAYGTEAGFFARAGIPTLVCGPGTMDDGHQPDEVVTFDQLAQCSRVLRRAVG